MNYSAFAYMGSEQAPDDGLSMLPGRSTAKAVPLSALHSCCRQELPVDVRVTSTTLEEGSAFYNLTTTSLATKHKWNVSYRYSEFDAFRSMVDEKVTCHRSKCYGTCQAIRDYILVTFPKKGLRLLSTSSGTIADRKTKLENVLLHLLRCVLIPGSAMKCYHLRKYLPKYIFAFLGVKDPLDQRSLLQLYVDDYQSSTSRASFESKDLQSDCSGPTVGSVESEQCMICLEDVEVDTCETECKDATSAVVLPCGHAFHRECVFEWLLFEFHCPMCRKQVGPSGITKYCRVKNQVQWWLGDFEENLLSASTE